MRIVIIDDHVSFRDSFRIAVEQQTLFKVVGEGGTGREARTVVERTRPDVAVLDFMLKDTDGIALLAEFKRRGLRVKTLMLARNGHPSFVAQAFRAGALGFALKQDALAEVLRGLAAVAAGQNYLSPRLSGSRHSEPNMIAPLTEREREVFCQLLDGLDTRQIAAHLCVSERTVHAHRLSINRKLGVHSVGQLTRLGASHRLLSN